MKTRSLFALLLLSFLNSCDPGKKSGDELSASPADSTQVTHSTETASAMDTSTARVLSFFTTETALPLLADTAFIAGAGGDSLPAEIIKSMTGSFFDHELTRGGEWRFRSFFEIDSVKRTGTYESWKQGLDIGSTMDSKAFAIGKIKLNENELVLIWSLEYSSYEACPWFKGKEIYYTLIANGNIGKTFVLAEQSAGGDPPVSMERTVTAKLEPGGKILLEVEQVNDEDMDQPLLEQERAHYEFQVSKGDIEVRVEQKDKPRKFKRKK